MTYALFFIIAGIIAIFAFDFSMASMLVGGVLIALGVFFVLSFMFEDDVKDNNTAFLVGAGVISAVFVGVLNSNFAPNNNSNNENNYGGSNINFRGKPGSRITRNGKTRYFDGTDFWWEGPGCEYCNCNEYYHFGENAGKCSNCPHSGDAHHD